MAEDASKVEVVYEPPFGPTGKTNLKDSIMFEGQIESISLDPESREKITNEISKLNNKGEKKFQPFVMDVIIFGEKDNRAVLSSQANAAIDAAKNEFYNSEKLPSLALETDDEDEETIILPIKTVLFDKKASTASVHTPIGELPLDSILILRDKRLSEVEYRKARDMIVNKANETLQIFNAGFRIPKFS